MLGWSMGASMALWLAARVPDAIAATAVFYGGQDIDMIDARSAFLGHYAEDDPYVDEDGLVLLESELHLDGLDVEFHRYPGTRHWFAEPDRPEHDEAAAALAWDRTLAFFRRHLPVADPRRRSPSRRPPPQSVAPSTGNRSSAPQAAGTGAPGLSLWSRGPGTGAQDHRLRGWVTGQPRSRAARKVATVVAEVLGGRAVEALAHERGGHHDAVGVGGGGHGVLRGGDAEAHDDREVGGRLQALGQDRRRVGQLAALAGDAEQVHAVDEPLRAARRAGPAARRA